MSKDRFMMWVSAVFATMMVVRVVVMSAPAERLVLGRSGMVDLALAIAMIAILALVHQRLLTSRLSGWWLVPVALWLIASVPLLRAILGQSLPSGGYPGAIQYWPEIPMLLLAFFAFAAFIEPPGAEGLTQRQKQMEWVAAILASVAIMARPYLIALGFEQLPYVDSAVTVREDLFVVMRGIEAQFNIVKDVGGTAPGLGNALTISLFCLALAAVVAYSRDEVRDVVATATGKRRVPAQPSSFQ